MRYKIQIIRSSGFTHYEIVDSENKGETIATVKNYIAALNLCEQLNGTSETYAHTKWSWEDVAGIKPEWSEDRCREWWKQNEKWFRDIMTQYGNEVLSDVLN